MSLLLEALKRAEEDAKRKRQAQASSGPVVVDDGDVASKSHVRRDRPSSSPPQPSPIEPPPAGEPLELVFPDLSLVPEEVKLPEPPPPLPVSMPVAAKVVTPVASTPPAVEAVTASPEKQASRDASNPAPGLTQPTPRQAKAAAKAMSPVPGQQGKPKQRNRRPVVLAALAVILLVPLLLLFVFGDSLLAPTSSVKAVAPPSKTTAGVVQPVAKAAETPIAAAIVVPQTAPTPLAATPSPTPVAKPAAPKAPARPAQAAQKTPAQVPQSAAAMGNAQGATAKGQEVALTRSLPKLASKLNAAFASFQAGRADEAVNLYREVLAADPTQRDAWLGLAVIAHGAGRGDEATDAYKRVLRLDPQNGTALAGLNRLQHAVNAPAEESRLRDMLATSAQNAELNHALGLVLASQARWSEAQPLFFKAHTLAASVPQYAFNLAVALDRLRKFDLARRYYQIALDLAEERIPGFDVTGARARLAALSDTAVVRTP